MLLLAVACTSPSVIDTEDTEGRTLRADLQLGFPLAERALFEPPVGFDHDPEDHTGAEQLICIAYDGRPFPACYDGHEGTDYLLEGGFEAMDAGSATVLAAAEGEVIHVTDGNYDRCHGTLDDGNDCDGNPMKSNTVVIEHADGWTTRYLHMMSGAMEVTVGQTVACGTPLGKVGSSGNSSTPHLHLELVDPESESVDPYAGEYSQPETFWLEQGDADGLPGGCAG